VRLSVRAGLKSRKLIFFTESKKNEKRKRALIEFRSMLENELIVANNKIKLTSLVLIWVYGREQKT
jgi:hypothetical protein